LPAHRKIFAGTMRVTGMRQYTPMHKTLMPFSGALKRRMNFDQTDAAMTERQGTCAAL
jgi:hypothetical protein